MMFIISAHKYKDGAGFWRTRRSEFLAYVV